MRSRRLLAPLVIGVLLLPAGAAFASEPVVEDTTFSVERVEYVGGDGDGVPEPGETLEVFIHLINAGERRGSISGTLTSSADHVTVVQGSSDWPALDVRESAPNTTAFVIRIANDAPVEEPCAPMQQGEPIDGGDEPVGSDDGTIMIAPMPVDPDDGREPADGDGADGREPADIEDGQDPTEAPDETRPEEPPTTEEFELSETYEPSEEQDPPVAFELVLSVTADGETGDVYVSSGIVCAFMDIGVPADADEAAFEVAPISARDGAASGNRGTAIALASVLLAAMAGTLGWLRFNRSPIA